MRSLLLLCSCLLAWPATADRFVLHNINGYDLDGDALVRFSTLVVEDGRVRERGDAALAAQYAELSQRDGGGHTVLPGLIDAHAHVMGLGEALLSVDLVGSRTRAEAVARVRAFAEANPDQPWIRGRGWNQTLWPENAFPVAADLDAAVADRPVLLERVDGHATWVNSLALKLANVTASTPDPDGGVVLKDTDGQPTGVLIDRASDLVTQLLPEQDRNTRREMLRRALERMATLGLTGVHDAGTSVADWELLRQFVAEGALTTRVYAMISGAGEVFDRLAAEGPVVDDLLALRSVKIYADGALGSRGAALLADYSDDAGNQGLLFDSVDAFHAMFDKVTDKRFQVGIHAIGDAANRAVLDAFERLRTERGPDGLRHRIEHAQVIALDDIPRFKTLDLIASMQPTHATSDMNMAEDRVGGERIRGAYAWRTLLDQGTIIAAGSDFPVEPVNPFFGLHAAVTRADHEGRPPDGWHPEHRLTRTEALRAFTLDAAFAGHAEAATGSLAPGKHADFIVIDSDYFTIPAADIHRIRVLETWLGGRQVYAAEHSDPIADAP